MDSISNSTASSSSDSMPYNNSSWVGVQPWKTLKALPPKGKLFAFSVFFMLLMYMFLFYSSMFDPNTMYSYEWKKFLRLQLDFSHVIPMIGAVLTALIPTMIVYHSCKKRNDRGAKMSHPLPRVIYYPFVITYKHLLGVIPFFDEKRVDPGLFYLWGPVNSCCHLGEYSFDHSVNWETNFKIFALPKHIEVAPKLAFQGTGRLDDRSRVTSSRPKFGGGHKHRAISTTQWA